MKACERKKSVRSSTRSWGAALQTIALLSLGSCVLLPAAVGCGSEEVVVKTADGVELSAKDIDNNPLALLPGGSLGTFSIDAPKLFQS
jgi:hypothetical protein